MEYVMADRKSVITKRGIIGPGEEIKADDLNVPDNFKALVKNGLVIKKGAAVEPEQKTKEPVIEPTIEPEQVKEEAEVKITPAKTGAKKVKK